MAHNDERRLKKLEHFEDRLNIQEKQQQKKMATYQKGQETVESHNKHPEGTWFIEEESALHHNRVLTEIELNKILASHHYTADDLHLYLVYIC